MGNVVLDRPANATETPAPPFFRPHRRWVGRLAWMLAGAIATTATFVLAGAAGHEPLAATGGTRIPAPVGVGVGADPRSVLPAAEAATIAPPQLSGLDVRVTVPFEPGRAFYASYVVYAGGRWGARVERVLVDEPVGIPIRIERVLIDDASDLHVRRRRGGGLTQGPLRVVPFRPFDLPRGESRTIHLLIRMTETSPDGTRCQPAPAGTVEWNTWFAPAPRVRYRSARFFTHEMALHNLDWGVTGISCDRAGPTGM